MSVITRVSSRDRGTGPAAATASPSHGAVAFSEAAQRLLMLSPIVLLASMYGVFRGMTAAFGTQPGFVAAFLVYWAVWGVAVPLWFVGRDGFADLFRPAQRRSAPFTILAVLALALPVLAGFLFVFPSLYYSADRLLLVFAVYAIVNGMLEEVYWRGLFVRAFPRDQLLGFLYPAAMFGAWHLVVLSMSGLWPPVAPLYAFILAASLGLLYAWVVNRTGSIRWAAASHVLLNLSGMGALIIFHPLS